MFLVIFFFCHIALLASVSGLDVLLLPRVAKTPLRRTFQTARRPRVIRCVHQMVAVEGSWPCAPHNGLIGDPPPPSAGSKHGFTAVMVVPTGIGAAIGGYAGDALSVAKALASVVDTLVTHPNVMNGASLYAPESNMLYVEGYALDEFCSGRWGLLPVRMGGHRIGLVLDRGIEPDLRLRHLQAADAARATLGINVAAYAVTERRVGVSLGMSPGGASWGTVADAGAAVDAARRLVEEAGCTAIAVVARFPDEDENDAATQAYREGRGVDPVGGAEAIISHLIVKKLKVPAAHAPALRSAGGPTAVSPRAAAEELGHTFLPCVLANLHRAPAILDGSIGLGQNDLERAAAKAEALWAHDVDAVVAPASALGGAGVLALAGRSGRVPPKMYLAHDHDESLRGSQLRSPSRQEKVAAADVATAARGGQRFWGAAGPLVVAVEDNATVMRAGARELGLKNVVTVRNYLEAAGVLAAHRCGVLPACLTAELPPLQRLI